MKRIISLIIISTFLLIMLNSCGTDEASKSEQITITIWHDKEAHVADVLKEAFTVLAPDINVVLEKKEGLTDSLKLVGNDPKAAPDMYFFAHDKVGLYAEIGILEPITTFVSKEKLDAYIDMTLSASTYKDEIYQLPIYYETLLFMYNRDLLSDENVPTTTEELYEYMKVSTKDGKFGFVEQHSTAYYSAPWIHGFNGKVINEEGEPLLTSDEVKDALNYHLKFLEYMPGESEYSTVNTLFLEGYASSTINGPWLVPSAREAGIDLGFAKMPIVDKTGIPLSPFSGVQGLHVLKVNAEERSDAIKKVFDVVMNPEIGIKIAQISGSAPAIQSCYSDERITGDAMIMAMKETAEAAVPMPNIPEMDAMFIVTGNLLVSVNMKGTDVESATESAQDKAIRIIDAMK